jgi:hypothetical protein
MKRFIIIVLALISAVLITEFFVAEIIGYPTFGVDKKAKISDNQAYQNLFKPFSEYWNVEGGNNVFKRNNLGFPGTDVKLSKDSGNIIVLGSSFVEAYQINPNQIATSIFQNIIRKDFSDLQVVNLGASGHDPYDSWLRIQYFKRNIKSDYVILVIQNTYEKWFKRHKQPLNFNPDNLGLIKKSRLNKYNLLLRNNSHFVSLLAQGMKQKNAGGSNSNKTEHTDKVDSVMRVPKELTECLKQYKSEYGDKFILVSIINNDKINSQLEQFCSENKICYDDIPMIKPEFMINGGGHLNEKGNKVLGEFLYETFIEKFETR